MIEKYNEANGGPPLLMDPHTIRALEEKERIRIWKAGYLPQQLCEYYQEAWGCDVIMMGLVAAKCAERDPRDGTFNFADERESIEAEIAADQAAIEQMKNEDQEAYVQGIQAMSATWAALVADAAASLTASF